MGRFLFWLIVLVFILSVILHYKVDLPYFLAWIGKLPGDFVVQKGKAFFYVPVTSAAICSLVLTAILSLFSRNAKK